MSPWFLPTGVRYDRPVSTPPTEASQGLSVDGTDPVALAHAIDLAFDYRGDVTIERAEGDPIAGYIFDRRAGDTPAGSIVRIIRADDGSRVTIPYAGITRLEFTGRDTAAGKSFETWMKKYVAAKLAGEEASIQSESLD